jgi:aspartyl-tRNA(Asn)/glutamyl-tRNA(Gln) amidotransferase subunit C
MAISDDDVLHVARLARLRLDDDEVGRMREQLSTILGHVQELSKLDLADVEPTAHALDIANSVRADRSRPSWPRDEVLREAPDPADGGFRVPPSA